MALMLDIRTRPKARVTSSPPAAPKMRSAERAPTSRVPARSSNPIGEQKGQIQ